MSAIISEREPLQAGSMSTSPNWLFRSVVGAEFDEAFEIEAEDEVVESDSSALALETSAVCTTVDCAVAETG